VDDVAPEEISRDEAVRMIDEYGIYTLRGADITASLERSAERLAELDEVQLVTVAEGTITYEGGAYRLDRSI
jgi:hypothetical protein